jgi:hypothetical protein
VVHHILPLARRMSSIQTLIGAGCGMLKAISRVDLCPVGT